MVSIGKICQGQVETGLGVFVVVPTVTLCVPRVTVTVCTPPIRFKLDPGYFFRLAFRISNAAHKDPGVLVSIGKICQDKVETGLGVFVVVPTVTLCVLRVTDTVCTHPIRSKLDPGNFSQLAFRISNPKIKTRAFWFQSEKFSRIKFKPGWGCLLLFPQLLCVL